MRGLTKPACSSHYLQLFRLGSQVTVLRNVMEAYAKALLLTELLQRGESGTASPGQPPGSSQGEVCGIRPEEGS